MEKKIESNPDKISERPYKKHKVKNPDKRNPNSDDPYEETVSSIKEMRITVSPHHPHHEEILDSTPK